MYCKWLAQYYNFCRWPGVEACSSYVHSRIDSSRDEYFHISVLESSDPRFQNGVDTAVAEQSITNIEYRCCVTRKRVARPSPRCSQRNVFVNRSVQKRAEERSANRIDCKRPDSFSPWDFVSFPFSLFSSSSPQPVLSLSPPPSPSPFSLLFSSIPRVYPSPLSGPSPHTTISALSASPLVAPLFRS